MCTICWCVKFVDDLVLITCNLLSLFFILDPKSKYQSLSGFHGEEGWRRTGTSDLPWHDGKSGDGE